MEKVELLAPAGNMECLKTAVYYGADAVYIAGKQYGLRAFAPNFTIEEIKEAADFLHSQNKRIYVTLNAVFRNEDFAGLDEYLLALDCAGIDAVIVSDPGVIARIRRVVPDMEIHLSTQMNISNAESAVFWHQYGVKRVVLSRELSLEEIREIRENTPSSMEIETFVHGAMCIAHSGRCLLSSVFTGRSGNKGECAQPCRWEYHLSEQGYPGEYFPIQEDDRGTYILNSKDLRMIEYIDKLVEAGITSLKVEGRMKSTYYVACVINAYRRAIDAYYANPDHFQLEPWLLEELDESATRRFTTGFYFGNPMGEGQDIQKAYPKQRYSFVALVRGEGREKGMILVEQRNKFSIGDTVRILSPHCLPMTFIVERIVNMDGEEQQSAPHAQQMLYINCPVELREGDILRKIRD